MDKAENIVCNSIGVVVGVIFGVVFGVVLVWYVVWYAYNINFSFSLRFADLWLLEYGLEKSESTSQVSFSYFLYGIQAAGRY